MAPTTRTRRRNAPPTQIALPANSAGSRPLINTINGLPHVVATRSRSTPFDGRPCRGCPASMTSPPPGVRSPDPARARRPASVFATGVSRAGDGVVSSRGDDRRQDRWTRVATLPGDVDDGGDHVMLVGRLLPGRLVRAMPAPGSAPMIVVQTTCRWRADEHRDVDGAARIA